MIAVFAICVLVLGLLHTSCDRESYEEKEARQQRAVEASTAQKQAHLNLLIDSFSTKYHADYEWMYGLRDTTISTLRLQRSLIRADHRPILAMANILDIENRNGALRVLFYVPHVGDNVLQRQHLVLDLQCPVSGVEAHKRTVGHHPFMEPTYLVAARIDTVRQAHQFGMTGSGSTLSPLTMEFIGEGQCMGLEAIEPITQDEKAIEGRHPRSTERKPKGPSKEY